MPLHVSSLGAALAPVAVATRAGRRLMCFRYAGGFNHRQAELQRRVLGQAQHVIPARSDRHPIRGLRRGDAEYRGRTAAVRQGAAGLIAAGLISIGYIAFALFLGLLLYVVVLWFVHNWFGGTVILACGMLLYVVLRYTTAGVETAVAYFVTWFLLISGTKVALVNARRPRRSRMRRSSQRGLTSFGRRGSSYG